MCGSALSEVICALRRLELTQPSTSTRHATLAETQHSVKHKQELAMVQKCLDQDQDRPELMTQTMSSMVTAVSAMLVARMILRTPTGGRRKTLRWSCVGTMECRGSS